MTLANKLTLTRLALAPLTFACLWSQQPRFYTAALALYTLATVTDWVDGWVARRTASISAFGALADPVADKVLVIGALIAFTRIPQLEVPSWTVFLIILRELVIGGLRALAAVSGKILSADWSGKWSMGVQSGCVLAMILILAVEANGICPAPWSTSASHLLALVCLGVSWVSGVLYLYRARTLLRDSWDAADGPRGG